MTVRIRVLGDRNTAFLSHRELDAALRLFPPDVEGRWTPTDADGAADLAGVDGLWVVPGSPYRDDDAVLAALRSAREADVPLLASCGGFQYALLELARNLAGLPDAQHAEVDPSAACQVVSRLSCSLEGQLRTVTPVPGTLLAGLVGEAAFEGFHFCNYGLSSRYLPQLRDAGVVINAHAPDAGVEGFELPRQRFLIGTLFQPQAGSSRGGPLHPLIAAFLDAGRARQAETLMHDQPKEPRHDEA